jgi:hypothetical protein
MATTTSKVLVTANWSVCRRTRTLWVSPMVSTAGVETCSPPKNGRSATAHVTPLAVETTLFTVCSIDATSLELLLTSYRWWTRQYLGRPHWKHTEQDRSIRDPRQLFIREAIGDSNVCSPCQHPNCQRICCTSQGGKQTQHSRHRSRRRGGYSRSFSHMCWCLVLPAP